jgi:hypothetical protein
MKPHGCGAHSGGSACAWRIEHRAAGRSNPYLVLVKFAGALTGIERQIRPPNPFRAMPHAQSTRPAARLASAIILRRRSRRRNRPTCCAHAGRLQTPVATFAAQVTISSTRHISTWCEGVPRHTPLPPGDPYTANFNDTPAAPAPHSQGPASSGDRGHFSR